MENICFNLRTFRVPLVVVSFFIGAEIIFRMGFFWHLPYKNSMNYSHEQQKIGLIEHCEKEPELIILGSSWAEYGIDAGILSKRTGLATLNLSIISSNLFEQSLIYKRAKTYFEGSPAYVVLLLDYSHIPVKLRTAHTKFLITPWELKDYIRFLSREYLNECLKYYIYLIRFRMDIQTAILGFITNSSMYYSLDKDIHGENIKVWEKEKRWQNFVPPSKPLEYNFKKKTIQKFVKFLKYSFQDTCLIIVEGPLAFPAKSNFPEIFSKEVIAQPGITYFDWRKELKFRSNFHFYDFDHLNHRGAILLTNWIAEKIGTL